MVWALVLSLCLGSSPVVKTKDFSKKRQVAALQATVRIQNRRTGTQGTGVIVGQKGPLVYILTASHVVRGTSKVEIETFTPKSYPKPAKTYGLTQVKATTPPNTTDLAIVVLIAEDNFPHTMSICPKKGNSKSFRGLSVGCSGGRAPTCLVVDIKGKKLVRKKRQGGGGYFWQAKQGSAKGSSGDPLVDQKVFLHVICSVS